MFLLELRVLKKFSLAFFITLNPKWVPRFHGSIKKLSKAVNSVNKEAIINNAISS